MEIKTFNVYKWTFINFYSKVMTPLKSSLFKTFNPYLFKYKIVKNFSLENNLLLSYFSRIPSTFEIQILVTKFLTYNIFAPLLEQIIKNIWPNYSSPPSTINGPVNNPVKWVIILKRVVGFHTIICIIILLI